MCSFRSLSANLHNHLPCLPVGVRQALGHPKPTSGTSPQASQARLYSAPRAYLRVSSCTARFGNILSALRQWTGNRTKSVFLVLVQQTRLRGNGNALTPFSDAPLTPDILCPISAMPSLVQDISCQGLRNGAIHRDAFRTSNLTHLGNRWSASRISLIHT